jgi:4-carboxymuconolactone decarboxylase
MPAPRIPPLPRDERDERTEEFLRALRPDPEAPDLNIFATLARHPRLLERWSAFGGVLLFAGTLPARDRELLILRTARNCQAHYEWDQHVRIALGSGVSQDEIDRLESGSGRDGEWDDDDRALLRAADELHTDATISDTTWDALRRRYDDQQLIEACMVVGQYHLVAFVLNALGVQVEDDPDAAGLTP